MSAPAIAKQMVSASLEKALVVQAPLAAKNVARLRRVQPEATPDVLIDKLNKTYLSAVTLSGGASGAAGVVPGAAVPTALADVLVFTEAISRTGGHWAKTIVESVPMTAINRANKVLGPHFVTKYGTKQGVLVLSKQVPLGIGALLGGGGNHVFGRMTLKSADRIFGPAPEIWMNGPTMLDHPADRERP